MGILLVTQKSDVYSFRAILLEVITVKKIVYDENCSLIIKFHKVYENENSGRAMLDKEIATEEDIFILEEIGKLAIECLKKDKEDQLHMTEVSEQLVMLQRDRKLGKAQNRNPRYFWDASTNDSPNSTEIGGIISSKCSMLSTPTSIGFNADP